MKIKSCKICGKWFVAKGRAEICGDDICKKGKKKLNNINEYQRQKVKGYDYNKFNRKNPDKKNKWNVENQDKSNNWVLNGGRAELRAENSGACQGDMVLDKNGKPRSALGSKEEDDEFSHDAEKEMAKARKKWQERLARRRR